jgi:hypothetical protein
MGKMEAMPGILGKSGAREGRPGEKAKYERLFT